MTKTNVDRAKLAYETFRGGFNSVDSFNSKPCPLPPWDEAPIHIREVVFVAYLQGTLDGFDRTEPHFKHEYGPDGMERVYQDGWVVR